MVGTIVSEPNVKGVYILLKSRTFVTTTAVRTELARFFHMMPHADNESITDVEQWTDAADLIRFGIIFLGKDGMPLEKVWRADAKIARKLFGASNLDWVNSLHASWTKVATAPIEQLVFEQVVHYFSTYDMERLTGASIPLFPVEDILADLDERPNIKAFTVIQYIDLDDASDLVAEYFESTVAPSKDAIEHASILMKAFDVSLDGIKSFEFQVIRYEQLGAVPKEGQNFLRFLIYKTTGSTLVIKNQCTIESIVRNLQQAEKEKFAHECFCNADLVELAKTFHRFKPLYLAFKKGPSCAPYINKIRKLADKYHEPMSDVTVQNLINLEHDYMRTGNNTKLYAVIQKCSIRQLVKLLNFTQSELAREDSRADNGIAPVYNIRNGKVFVPQAETASQDHSSICLRVFALADLRRHLLVQLRNLVEHKLDDKTFLIPAEMHYAVPTSEKQFIGNIPYGSCITLPEGKSFCAAIRWENTGRIRNDLDLHMQSLTRAFGWNSSYRSDNCDVLYSGDVTDARDGAVEAYLFSPNENEVFLLSLSKFCGADKVDFQFFMTDKGFNHNHAVRGGRSNGVCDIADALFAPIPMACDSGSISLGLFVANSFYFYGGNLGSERIPKRELYGSFITAFSHRLTHMMDLSDLIRMAGGTVTVNESEPDGSDYIDLRPSALSARSIMKIIDELNT